MTETKEVKFIKSFFNTIDAKGEQLNLFVRQAATQEQRVFFWFKKVGRGTALDAADRLNIHESSARRSCHNLEKKGLLRRTDEQKMGKYLKPNSVYEYVEIIVQK